MVALTRKVNWFNRTLIGSSVYKQILVKLCVCIKVWTDKITLAVILHPLIKVVHLQKMSAL